MTNATPAVTAVARRLGVALTGIEGTGVGGRIRPEDVYAKAGRQPGARPMAAAALPPPMAMPTQSKFDATKVVQVDPYGANPLVEDCRQVNPDVLAMALLDGPAPTLFSTGSEPVLTASGIDPQLLMRLPWQARHAAARADRAGVAAMFDQFASGGSQADREASATDAALVHGSDSANLDYEQRVRSWLMGRPTY